MSTWALIMAAGMGARMGADRNKVLLPLAGVPVLVRTVQAFAGQVDGIAVVTRQQDREEVQALLPALQVIAGGDTRQASVLAGLCALPQEVEHVLVHDAARPFVDAHTIARCVASVKAHGSAVASVAAKDTIKRVDAEGLVVETPPREALRQAQTPQAFRRAELLQVIEALEQKGITATDDAGAMEAAGHPVRMVEGSYRNIKLTTPEDLAFAEHMLAGGQARVGQGYDVHQLVEGRKLILCGVEVPYEKGLLGHSDADVATHALMDAMLGALALGDIGRHFPDTDARYKGIPSIALLEHVVGLLADRGYGVSNADITIVAQRPKLSPYITEMAACIARVLGIAGSQVNVKATTSESLGFEGEGLGISSHAVVLLGRR